MKYLIILSVLFLCGCAGAQLKKCSSDIPSDIYYCNKKVDGDFRMCTYPNNIYRCVDPQ